MLVQAPSTKSERVSTMRYIKKFHGPQGAKGHTDNRHSHRYCEGSPSCILIILRNLCSCIIELQTLFLNLVHAQWKGSSQFNKWFLNNWSTNLNLNSYRLNKSQLNLNHWWCPEIFSSISSQARTNSVSNRGQTTDGGAEPLTRVFCPYATPSY